MLTLNIFSSVLCRNVHRHQAWEIFADFVCSKSLCLKTKLRAKQNNFKIISASSLICLAVTRQGLLNSSSADFGAFSTNQFNQNQVKYIFGVSFRLIVLCVFFLVLTFQLQRVTSSLVPWSPLQSVNEIWLSNS